MKQSMQDALRRGALGLAAFLLVGLAYGIATRSPDWSLASDVRAPLTRTLLYIHPPSAWAAFAAAFVAFGASVATLNERTTRYDRAARAATEVGFLLTTLALWTGTFWGIQEWSRSGEAPLATVYSEPKVLVVLILWFAFAASLLLRRLVDGPERRARLAAAFNILAFVMVPVSFGVSRVMTTSLHPDVAGPGANADAAVSGAVGGLLGLGAAAFLALFLALFLQRVRVLALEDRLEALEAAHG